MLESRRGQRVFGSLGVVAGGWITAWVWYTALEMGHFYPKLVILGPLLALLGLGPILFPLAPDNETTENHPTDPRARDRMPRPWLMLLLIGAALGFVNLLLISRN